MSISSRGYDSPQLQDQLVIPETDRLACVWSIWCHECTGWLSGSKRNSVHTEANPWSCSRVASFSLLGEMPFSCMSRPWLVPCHLLNRWREGPMLNLSDPLLICPPLLILILSVHSCHGGFAAAWCKRVEHLYIKNARCCLFHQNPWALISAQASSSVCAVRSFLPQVQCEGK